MGQYEQILVVERERLFHNGAFQGFRPLEEGRDLLRAVAQGHFFTQRGPAEENPLLKQPIPYVVLRCNGEVMVYRRLKGGGEKRLHGNASIGIGGHINPVDFDPAWREHLVEIDFDPFLAQCEGIPSATYLLGIVQNGVQREVSEEVFVDATGAAKLLGFLNDDSNAVGKVHLGLVFALDLPTKDVRIREDESHELVGWFDQGGLADLAPEMETWSQILVKEAL